MSSFKELVIAGIQPSAAIRQCYGDMVASDLIIKIDKDLNGIPAPVVHAIANWNRRQIPGREGFGLNDSQFDEVVRSSLLEKGLL